MRTRTITTLFLWFYIGPQSTRHRAISWTYGEFLSITPNLRIWTNISKISVETHADCYSFCVGPNLDNPIPPWSIISATYFSFDSHFKHLNQLNYREREAISSARYHLNKAITACTPRSPGCIISVGMKRGLKVLQFSHKFPHKLHEKLSSTFWTYCGGSWES